MGQNTVGQKNLKGQNVFGGILIGSWVIILCKKREKIRPKYSYLKCKRITMEPKALPK
jgi:hypothetical protein